MQRWLIPALALCALAVGTVAFLATDRATGAEAAARLGASIRTESPEAVDAPPKGDQRERVHAQPVATSTATAAPEAKRGRDPTRGTLEVLVVREEDDSPIPGARVLGRPRSSSEDLGARVTSADGRTRWSDVAARRLHLEATAPGRTTASVELVFDPEQTPMPFVVRLPAQRDVRVRLVDLRGQAATPAGLGFDPAASANLSIGLAAECTAVGQVLDRRGAPTHRTRVDSWNGTSLCWSVQIRGLDRACVHVLLGDIVLAATPLYGSTTELSIPISREDVQRALEPVVVNVMARSDSAPISGADVSLVSPSRSSVRATSDDSGTVRFESFLAGEFDVVAKRPGFAASTIRVRRPVKTTIELWLVVGHDVEGRVVDEAGAPRAGVVLTAYDAAAIGTDARALGSARTDAEGRFAFSMLPVEEVLLVTSASDDVDFAFLPKLDELPQNWHVVHCRGGVRGVVIPWVPQDEPFNGFGWPTKH